MKFKDYNEEIEGWKHLPITRTPQFFIIYSQGNRPQEFITPEVLVDLAFGC